MKQGFGMALGVLAIIGTGFFIFVVLDAIFGDYAGGEVLVVWVIAAVAALLSAAFWAGSWALLKDMPDRESPSIPPTRRKTRV